MQIFKNCLNNWLVITYIVLVIYVPKKDKKEQSPLVNHKNLERNVANEIAKEFYDKDNKKK